MYITQKTFVLAALITCIALFFSACTTTTSKQQGELQQEQKHFPIKQFFEEEIAYHEAQQSKVDKYIELNGQTEKQQLAKVKWARELALFVQSDINKAAWMEQYKVDTLQEKQARIIRYTALNKDLKTREIHLTFALEDSDFKQVQSVQIDNNTENIIYKHHEILYYQRQEKYRIQTEQSVLGLTPDKMLIEGKFMDS